MPSQPPIPPLLSPYLSTAPSASLTLLTSTLGATSNWLILRFICAALKNTSSEDGSTKGDNEATTVVLVSWLRDATFWKDGGRKLGINFQKVHIIDALTTGLGIGASSLADVETEILKAITTAKPTTRVEGEERVLLVLDGLDFLLAATSCSTLETLDLVGELREHVYTTLLTSAADLPLTQSPTTPLEISHTALIMTMVHQARLVMSAKSLDTGVARDVSGVLRICKGAGAGDKAQEGEGELEEREFLYFVGADGGVRVFERGA
ncbi:hypothetical protein N7G274_004007 [Stereocaulon virgatum]|uniref:Uncharacterized protein n=1 Tax=Stereocaulon virgatum TaxID=373712 RepID=A0ABR4AE11_9LECA